MNLDDIKTGYVVEIRKGDKYLMLRDVENVKHYGFVKFLGLNQSNKSFFRFDDRYDEALMVKNGCANNERNYDIMRIWGPRIFTNLLQFNEKMHKLIYERNEEMEKKNDVNFESFNVVLDETGRMAILAPRFHVDGFMESGSTKSVPSIDDFLKNSDDLTDFSLFSFVQNQRTKKSTEDAEICTAENAADLAHDTNCNSENVNKFLSWLFNKIIELAKKGQYECEVLKCSAEFVNLARHERVFIQELLEQLNFNVIEDEKNCSWVIDWHQAAQIMSM
jgi:hypothetical protein